jgi:hypothetical protein
VTGTDVTDLTVKLNLETARLPWSDLARYFAGGRLIRVATDMDLLNVAAAVAEDQSAKVSRWLEDDQVRPVSDDEARRWHEAQVSLWAVVIKPWVLVQESAGD